MGRIRNDEDTGETVNREEPGKRSGDERGLYETAGNPGGGV